MDVLGMEKTSAYASNENLVVFFIGTSSARNLKYKLDDIYYKMKEKLRKYNNVLLMT